MNKLFIIKKNKITEKLKIYNIHIILLFTLFRIRYKFTLIALNSNF